MQRKLNQANSDKTKFLLKNLNIISTEPSRGLQLATGASNSYSFSFYLHTDTKQISKCC